MLKKEKAFPCSVNNHYSGDSFFPISSSTKHNMVFIENGFLQMATCIGRFPKVGENCRFVSAKRVGFAVDWEH